VVGLVVVVGILVWAGATLLIGCHQIRRLNRRLGRRLDLAERVIRDQPGSLADEAYEWLQRQ
jgi:hypothetical protein